MLEKIREKKILEMRTYRQKKRDNLVSNNRTNSGKQAQTKSRKLTKLIEIRRNWRKKKRKLP